MKRTILLLLTILFMLSSVSCTRKPKESAHEANTPIVSKQEEKNKVELTLEQKINGDNGENSGIFAVKNTNGADTGFEKLVDLMDSQGLSFYRTSLRPDGLIGKEDVVLLKFNCQWAQRGGTNTDLIKSVIDVITKHPEKFEGEIIIADNGQAQYGSKRKGGSVEWEENNAIDISQSVKKVADTFLNNYKVSAMTWDDITTKEVKDYNQGDYEDGFIVSSERAATGICISYPKFKTRYGTYVSFKDGIWNEEQKKYNKGKLKVINMPILKSHMTFNVTASIKNYMGTVSDKLTDHTSHTSVGVGGMGTQMAGTRMPVLNILDAIWINPRPNKGPSTSYASAVETNIITASTDPAALDYWASKYILMAAAKELNFEKYQTMDPDGEQPGSFGYWLRKSMEEIKKSGFKTTIDEKKINTYIHILN